eukprot:GFUD01020836.1.p1 GENE.GFUD01020836.1~~GFUD01020836.1.p1  ORF type:complete len:285 (-),score=89.94 GFUD01020836.1:97-951(-)
MAVYKILSVFLVVAGPSAWTTPQFSPSPSTTPIPILRYINNQNTDGSYTYGFEGADGTYKLETRFTDGRVKGKYGYYDPEGVLRQATYGAEAGRGFEPQIEGLELPPPTIEEEIQNEIPQSFEPEIQNPQRFKNFQPISQTSKKLRNFLPRSDSESVPVPSNVKIVNGRRAVIKRRLRAKATPVKATTARATPAPAPYLDPQVQRENNLRAREEQLKTLRDHRQQLLLLQQRQSGARQSYPRSFNGFQQNQQPETFRSASPSVSDPYVTGLDLNSGSYSYSYRR